MPNYRPHAYYRQSAHQSCSVKDGKSSRTSYSGTRRAGVKVGLAQVSMSITERSYSSKMHLVRYLDRALLSQRLRGIVKAVPQGLKPSTAQAQCGTAEAVPFVQSLSSTCKAWISRPSGAHGRPGQTESGLPPYPGLASSVTLNRPCGT